MIQTSSNLELHATHLCNLSCDNCSHFSNYQHHGILSVEEAGQWMAPWGRRVEPYTFLILGGEPTLHPELSDLLVLSRRCFSTTTIRLITNGTYLHRHPALPHIAKANNIEISITEHADADSRRTREFEAIKALAREWLAMGVKISIPPPYPWVVRYRGHGESIMPFEDGNPFQSWSKCCDPNHSCVQLHEGRLWKCSLLAYLPMMKSKYPRLSSAWDVGLAYRPIGPEASDKEVIEFFERREETVCGLCPSRWIPGKEGLKD